MLELSTKEDKSMSISRILSGDDTLNTENSVTKLARLAAPVQKADLFVATDGQSVRLGTKHCLTTFFNSEVNYGFTLHWYMRFVVWIRKLLVASWTAYEAGLTTEPCSATTTLREFLHPRA